MKPVAALLSGLGTLTLALPVMVSVPAPAATPPTQDRTRSHGGSPSSTDDLAIRLLDEGDLIEHGSVRVCVDGARRHFKVIVGMHDVTKRFHRLHHRGGRDTRCASLRRGRDVEVGENRLVASIGSGTTLRHATRTFTVGRHAHGRLRVRLKSDSRSLLHVRVAGPRSKPFEYVRIRLNGRRIDTEDWVLGDRTPSTQWPRGITRFTAMFGADDGVRHGMNRLTITAWRPDGSYDRERVHAWVHRSTPLVSGGEGARVPVGRTVSVEAGTSSAPRGAPPSIEWHVVDAPDASTAVLDGSDTAGSTFVPDVPGTYRLRVTADAVRTCRSTHDRHRNRCNRGATSIDETTVKAVPDSGPLGSEVTTITADGSIKVDDTTYPAEDGAWAQLVVLNRATLEMVHSQSFHNPSDASFDAVSNVLDEYGERNLVILSGGGRAQTIPPDSGFWPALIDMFVAAGASPYDAEPDAMVDTLESGQWSLIGVPGVTGSATTNLLGTQYGMAAGDDSRPGALTGYLRADPDGNFGFASAAHATLNTNVAGAPAGANTIKVGSDSYTSDRLPSGSSGFHVLVLDSTLSKVDEETFNADKAHNSGGKHDLQNMTSFLLERREYPDQLVVVQSIGAPYGQSSDWVNDGPIVNDAPAQDYNKILHRGPQTWYASSSTGASLAEAIGLLGGVAAHDAFAKLSINGQDGYALVASIGQMPDSEVSTGSTPVPIDSSSSPTSLAMVGNPGGRVVGNLTRDHRALWKLSGASATDEPADFFATGTMRDLINQEATPWPAWTTDGQRAADCYIADQVFPGERLSSIRQEYPSKMDLTWSGLLSDVHWTAGATCPTDSATFSEDEFDDVKAQLSTEVDYVAKVKALVQSWQKPYTESKTDQYVDLQHIAQGITEDIEGMDESEESTLHTVKIVDDSLKLAGSMASVVPFGGVAFGVAANTVSLAADSSTTSDGVPSLSPLRAKVSDLGEDLVARIDSITQRLDLIYQILVSDWGKLQTAAKSSGDWTPDTDSAPRKLQILRIAAKQEIYSALLPTVYGLYYVDPPYIMQTDDPTTEPEDIQCRNHDVFNPGMTTPWGGAPEVPSAWETSVTQTVSIDFPPGHDQVDIDVALSTHADIRQGGQMFHNPHQPDLSDMGGDALFAPLVDGDESKLGMDKTTLFADSRFTTRWFWCNSNPPGSAQ